MFVEFSLCNANFMEITFSGMFYNYGMTVQPNDRPKLSI